MIIASVRPFQLDSGVAKTRVYDNTLYLMAALLFVGLICNLLVRPVDPKHYMSEAEQNAERALQHDQSTPESARSAARGPFGAVGVIFWLAVGVTFLIGVWIALMKAAALF
jgi:hypothetical protein